MLKLCTKERVAEIAEMIENKWDHRYFLDSNEKIPDPDDHVYYVSVDNKLKTIRAVFSFKISYETHTVMDLRFTKIDNKSSHTRPDWLIIRDLMRLIGMMFYGMGVSNIFGFIIDDKHKDLLTRIVINDFNGNISEERTSSRYMMDNTIMDEIMYQITIGKFYQSRYHHAKCPSRKYIYLINKKGSSDKEQFSISFKHCSPRKVLVVYSFNSLLVVDAAIRNPESFVLDLDKCVRRSNRTYPHFTSKDLELTIFDYAIKYNSKVRSILKSYDIDSCECIGILDDRKDVFKKNE